MMVYMCASVHSTIIPALCTYTVHDILLYKVSPCNNRDVQLYMQLYKYIPKCTRQSTANISRTTTKPKLAIYEFTELTTDRQLHDGCTDKEKS